MPVFSGPYPDPEEDEHPEPEGLKRLRAEFTYDRQLETFRQVFGREPQDDEELGQFADEYTREMYNSGYDEIP